MGGKWEVKRRRAEDVNKPISQDCFPSASLISHRFGCQAGALNFKHDRPTNPERNMDMWSMETFSRHRTGRRALAMLKASMAMCRARGCALPCCADLECVMRG